MQYYTYIAELLALIACVLLFGSLRKSILKWFLLLLVVTNIVEWGNHFKLFTIVYSNGMRSNNWIINLLNIFEFVFYGLIYKAIITNKKDKKRITVFLAVLLVAILLNILFVQGMFYFDSYTFILGACYLVYCSALFFKQQIQHIDNQNIFSQSFFWISLGLLFFCSGQAILVSFFQYFLYIKNFKSFLPVWRFFNNFLNIILYASLIIAFLCSRKQYTI